MEARTELLELPDQEADVFQFFQLWLYSSELKVVADDKALVKTILLKLWVLGDTLDIPCLQNEAMDEFIKLFESDIFPISKISWVYQNTIESSLLRKLCVDVLVHRGHASDDNDWYMDEDIIHYPKEFLFAVSKGQCQLLTGRKARQKDLWSLRWDYHVPES